MFSGLDGQFCTVCTSLKVLCWYIYLYNCFYPKDPHKNEWVGSYNCPTVQPVNRSGILLVLGIATPIVLYIFYSSTPFPYSYFPYASSLSLFADIGKISGLTWGQSSYWSAITLTEQVICHCYCVNTKDWINKQALYKCYFFCLLSRCRKMFQNSQTLTLEQKWIGELFRCLYCLYFHYQHIRAY